METSKDQKQFDLLNDDPEISDEILEATTFYVQTLAVPARRNLENPEVRKGASLFSQANCIGCHTPTFKTGKHPTIPEMSNQLIHPYTDLLLHDMGEGRQITGVILLPTEESGGHLLFGELDWSMLLMDIQVFCMTDGLET